MNNSSQPLHLQAFEATTRFIKMQKENLMSHNLHMERKMIQLEVEKEQRNVLEHYKKYTTEDTLMQENNELLKRPQYTAAYTDFARTRLNRFFGHINEFVVENTPSDAGVVNDDFDAGRMCHTQ
jgi:hypothetical protein